MAKSPTRIPSVSPHKMAYGAEQQRSFCFPVRVPRNVRGHPVCASPQSPALSAPFRSLLTSGTCWRPVSLALQAGHPAAPSGGWFELHIDL